MLKEDFTNKEHVNAFDQVIPLTFDKTKFGESWYAPKEWVGACELHVATMMLTCTLDTEQAKYYTENPEAIGMSEEPRIKAELAKLEKEEFDLARQYGREPFTKPV